MRVCVMGGGGKLVSDGERGWRWRMLNVSKGKVGEWVGEEQLNNPKGGGIEEGAECAKFVVLTLFLSN